MAALVPGGWFARAGQALCRRAPPRRHAVWRQDRRREGVRGYRRLTPLRFRRRAGTAADPGVYAAAASVRRAGLRGPERGLCLLPGLSHLGPATGCWLGWLGADELGRVQ